MLINANSQVQKESDSKLTANWVVNILLLSLKKHSNMWTKILSVKDLRWMDWTEMFNTYSSWRTVSKKKYAIYSQHSPFVQRQFWRIPVLFANWKALLLFSNCPSGTIVVWQNIGMHTHTHVHIHTAGLLRKHGNWVRLWVFLISHLSVKRSIYENTEKKIESPTNT